VESSDGTRYWYKEGALVQAPDQMPAAGAKVTSTTAAAGLVVKRGADWKWGDQDGGGLGVLVKASDTAGWWTVKWLSGSSSSSNQYRTGADGKHDLQHAECEAAVEAGRLAVGDSVLLAGDYKEHGDAGDGPLLPGRVGKLLEDDRSTAPYRVEAPGGASTWWYAAAALVRAPAALPALGTDVTPATAAAGLVVQRGRSWKWGDQDGGGLGVLLNADSDGWWRVRWLDGSSNAYRVGQDSAHDLAHAAFYAGALEAARRAEYHIYAATPRVPAAGWRVRRAADLASEQIGSVYASTELRVSGPATASGFLKLCPSMAGVVAGSEYGKPYAPDTEGFVVLRSPSDGAEGWVRNTEEEKRRRAQPPLQAYRGTSEVPSGGWRVRRKPDLSSDEVSVLHRGADVRVQGPPAGGWLKLHPCMDAALRAARPGTAFDAATEGFIVQRAPGDASDGWERVGAADTVFFVAF